MIDAHVHVWDPRELSYPWLAGIAELDRPMLPDTDVGDADAAIFVEADCLPEQSLAEARWVSRLGWPGLRGIVAAADLRSPTLFDDLDRLAAIPAVVGIRHLLQDEDDREWDADATLVAGLHTIAARGLTFDACVRWPQLDALAALLERVPDLKVVLDHLGKPPVDEGVDSVAGRRWCASMARIAEHDTTYVKLSGLAAESADRATFDRHADGFIRAGLDLFGAERAMIGSDWPVSTLLGAAETPDLWRARVLAVAASLGLDGDAVGSRTAARFYAID